jgi:hypothetical protein
MWGICGENKKTSTFKILQTLRFFKLIVEQKGVKSNYFNEDLDIFTTNYLQE